MTYSNLVVDAPAEWTHAHSGGVVKKGSKYIVTGWIQFA